MGKHYILGIDEAGRGPWAGPVVVAGWFLAEEEARDIYNSLPGLTDSKSLRENERVSLEQKMIHLSHKIIEQSAEIIDQYGMREANRKGMEKIIEYYIKNLGGDDTLHIWIDGCDNYEFDLDEKVSYTFAAKSNQKKKKPSSIMQERIHIEYRIAGDLHIPCVSGASILAKVYRDTKMCEFGVIYPKYGFEQHKGYGTRLHSEALINYGITPIHRKSYAPVKRLISQTSSV